MNNFVADLVIAGIYKNKQDFITSACLYLDVDLLSYINLYKSVNKWSKKYKEVNVNRFDCDYKQWSNFFVDRNKILSMMDNQDLELNKDYTFYTAEGIDGDNNISNSEGPKDLLLSSNGVNKILSLKSLDSIESIQNIAYNYKYYLDNLFYLNMNVYNSDYIEDNE